MWEATGSTAGVAVADPRQVFTMLLAPLSTPYGGGGWWQVAGWPAVPSSQPFPREGKWVEGLVVGVQLENTSTLEGGLYYKDFS